MSIPDIDIGLLQQWVGRKERRDDVATLAAATGLAATLDWQVAPKSGDLLPPLWHWTYFTPIARQSDMGDDGHPKLGGFMPPIPLPRRMWAGGRVRFETPILIGEAIWRETEILKITLKVGKEGPLVFVTLLHQVSTARGLAISEEQDIVYRTPSSAVAPVAAAKTSGAPSTERRPAAWRDAIAFDPVMLFRYSALTFNAHRIHYDAPYANGVEGYRALVVHGPFTATLLADRLVAHSGGRLSEFEFRGQRPLFVDAPATFCGQPTDAEGGYEVWAETPDGGTGMAARARLVAA